MELFYRQAGAGEPVIILHGLFGTSDNWQIIAKKMSETHQIFTVDLRNHGQSYHSDDFGYGLMAEDIESFIDQHFHFQPCDYWSFHGREGSHAICPFIS